MGVPGNANALLLRSAAAAGGYQVSRSLRFDAASTSYLSRTPGSAGTRTTYTLSVWVKRAALSTRQMIFSANNGGDSDAIYFHEDNTLRFFQRDGLDSSLITTQVFRDASAWYHIVLAVDTTQGTSSNRVKLYVNGTQVTTFSTASYPSSSYTGGINNTVAHNIGRRSSASDNYLDAYVAECHFIDGSAKVPGDFAETDATTGQWIPKLYSGSYGTNGFKLTFSDNSAATAAALGKDTSGNSNNWTPNNLSVTAGAGNDSLVDTPTSVSATDTGIGGEIRGNYCTWNPLAKNSALNLANGNLDDSTGTPGIDGIGLGTIGASVGKFYWELTVNSTSGGNNPIIGVVPTSAGLIEVGSNNANSVGYLQSGSKRINGSTTSYGNSFTTGDVVGVALDLDNGAIYFSKNGTWQNSGVPTSGSSKTGAAHTWTGGSVEMTPAVREYNSSCSANWGQRSFTYTAPSGFKCLCDTSLPLPVVAKPSGVMDVALWQGDGATTRTITLAGGMSPDFVWIKNRAFIYDHILFDSIRGTQQALKSNSTGSESTLTNSLTTFGSGSFGLGKDNSGEWNFSSAHSYVAWAWDAGSSTVTNTQGSISSQVRANASAGFSIATYTGTGSAATVGHGLGAGVGMLIIKNRNSANEWVVGHTGITLGSGRLYLNTTDANDTAGASALWNSTAATSSVFSVGTNSKVNSSGGTYVAYVFSPVTGYSSFGSYTGNGSTDGPFVYTGFRPRWIMVKCSSTNNGYTFWDINDAARSDYNSLSRTLCANLSDAEDSANIGTPNIDILSNGFKIRTTGSAKNLSSQTYIYAAFAENPFQYARAR